jgi:hypothetical protein
MAIRTENLSGEIIKIGCQKQACGLWNLIFEVTVAVDKAIVAVYGFEVLAVDYVATLFTCHINENG